MASVSRQSNDVQARNKKLLIALRKQPGNEECMDCNSRNPTWASINLGIFMCARCAGLHRNLGVHISQVRSTSLDLWESKWIERVSKIGNTRAKLVWEAALPKHYDKPDADEDDDVVQQWIRAKYEARTFYQKPGTVQQSSPITPQSPSSNESTPTRKKRGSSFDKFLKERNAEEVEEANKQPPRSPITPAYSPFSSDAPQSAMTFATPTPTLVPTSPVPTLIPTTNPTPTLIPAIQDPTPAATLIPTPTLIPISTSAPCFVATPSVNPSLAPTLIPTTSPTPTLIPTSNPTPTLLPATGLTSPPAPIPTAYPTPAFVPPPAPCAPPVADLFSFEQVQASAIPPSPQDQEILDVLTISKPNYDAKKAILEMFQEGPTNIGTLQNSQPQSPNVDTAQDKNPELVKLWSPSMGPAERTKPGHFKNYNNKKKNQEIPNVANITMQSSELLYHMANMMSSLLPADSPRYDESPTDRGQMLTVSPPCRSDFSPSIRSMEQNFNQPMTPLSMGGNQSQDIDGMLATMQSMMANMQKCEDNDTNANPGLSGSPDNVRSRPSSRRSLNMEGLISDMSSMMNTMANSSGGTQEGASGAGVEEWSKDSLDAELVNPTDNTAASAASPVDIDAMLAQMQGMLQAMTGTTVSESAFSNLSPPAGVVSSMAPKADIPPTSPVDTMPNPVANPTSPGTDNNCSPAPPQATLTTQETPPPVPSIPTPGLATMPAFPSAAVPGLAIPAAPMAMPMDMDSMLAQMASLMQSMQANANLNAMPTPME